MEIATTRFGVLDAADEQFVELEGGLLGFPDASRFIRVPLPDADGWQWLQSVDDGELAFLSISAFRFFPHYDLELPESDVEAIALETPEDADVLALVTIRRSTSGEVDAITANLLGPIVINTTTGLGRQVVLADSPYSTREIVADQAEA